ncbi:MAG: alpha/beta hydrolase [Chloroflexi bacterium]|nr:alpha/beta hydrolase [Chloroflexota bacterium]
MATSFATINGYRLRYRLQGAGELAVFGHGVMGSIEQIDEHHPALTALHGRIRLLVYDARGHGQSDGPTDSAHYTWESLGRDMSAFIDHAGETRAILGGGSMGAATALWVAIEQPERAKALVLVMPPPLGLATVRELAEKQALQLLEMLAAAVKNFGIEKTVELARQFPGFAATPEEADARAAWLLGQNPLTLAYAIDGLIDSAFHDPECYRAIRVPVLVIAHEGDGLHPARAAHLLKQNIPDCTLAVAPDPGYWRAHPGEFLAEVTAFLDRVAG